MKKDQDLKPIRTISYAIDDGISATLAAAILLKESNRARDEGWDEVTFYIRTEQTKFVLSIWGVK
jgi:hypothetical protein